MEGCRSVTKKDMLYNDATPDIDINPETYQVKVYGVVISGGSPAQRRFDSTVVIRTIPYRICNLVDVDRIRGIRYFAHIRCATGHFACCL